MDKKAVWKEFWRLKREEVANAWDEFVDWFDDWFDIGEFIDGFKIIFFALGGFVTLAFFLTWLTVAEMPKFLIQVPVIWVFGVVLFLVYRFIKWLKSNWNTAMENTSKTEDQPVVKAPEPEKPKVSFVQIVEEIKQNSQALVDEYNDLVTESYNEDFVKYLKLYENGFTRITGAREANEKNKRLKYLAIVVQKIVEYKDIYRLPFIADDSVAKICEKYGLLLGDSGDFIGNVPDGAIDEIVKLDLLDEHAVYCVGTPTGHYYQLEYSYYNKNRFEKLKTDYGDDDDYIFIGKKPVVKIIATPDCFDMEGKTTNSKFEIIDRDPIVLRKVVGGYLVVTHWE